MSEELAGLFSDLFHAQLELVLAQSNRHISNDHTLLLFDVALPLFLDDFIAPVEPPTADRLGHARWRDEYHRIQRNKPKAADWMQITVDAFWPFLTQLPQPSTQSQFTCQITFSPTTVLHIAAPFIADENPDFFKRLKSVLTPRYNAKDPTDIIKGTPLEQIFPVTVPLSFEAQRFEHHHICAKSGHGKTTLYSVMLERDLERVARGEASVIVMDSQGDFLEKEVLHYKEFAPGRSLHDRLIYVNPTDIEHPIHLNVFARTDETKYTTPVEKHRQRTAIFDLFTFVFVALDQKMTGRQETLFRAVSALILEIPNANLSVLNDLFEPTPRKADVTPLARFQKYISRLDEAEQKFFNTDFHTNEFAETRGQIRARVQSIIMNPVFRNMFNATRQTLDLTHEMQRGSAILINCNRDFLGNGTELFGRFFIALIRRATQAREHIPDSDRTPCFVYIDECQQYVSNDHNVTDMLATARKYKVAMLLAHQNLSQLNRVNVQPAVQGCAIKMVGQPNDDDTRTLASQLRTTKEFLEAQPIGTFATFVNGVTSSAVALKVPMEGLRTKPKMTDTELQKVIDSQRKKYCTPEVPQPTHTPTREAAEIAAASTPIQEQGSNTHIIPQPSPDIPLAVATSARIETFLVSHYGASGSGLHTKLDSIQATLPAHLMRPGRFIATIRNKVVHEGLVMPDRDREYFQKCAQAFDDYFSKKTTDTGEIPSDPEKRW